MTEDKDKEFDSTQDKSGDSGKGKAGGSGGGGIRLPPTQLKEVTSNWEYLDAAKVAARVAEFFSELPAKASAHVQVSWANLQNKGYTIVTQILKWGQEVGKEIAYLMQNLSRENAEILRARYGLNVTAPS
jgi:hypothetical protein